MKKKLITLSFLFALAITLTGSLFVPKKALAATPGRWVNIAVLEVDGKRYQEDKIDNNWHFYLIGDPDGCTDEIDQLDYNPDAQNEGPFALPKDNTVRLQVKEKSPSGCTVTSTQTVNLSNNDAAKYSFNWVDKGTIEIPGQGTTFKKDDSLGGAFVRSGDNECKDTLEAGPGASSLSLIVRVTRKKDGLTDVERRNDLRSGYQGHSWVDQIDYDKEEGGGACIISDKIDGLPIGLVSENSGKEAGTGTGSGGPESGGASAAPSCESNGGKMSWILCPVLEYVSSFLQKVDEQLNHLLQVPNNYFECAPSDPASKCDSVKQLKDSWARMRNVAYIFLVPIVLVMVIGTALGFELVSAYTVKKALPRLVIALIFMSLSYEITRFFIVVTNDIGKGVLGLMTSTFSGQKDVTLAELFDPGGGSGLLATFVISAGVGLALGALGIIISYAFVIGVVLFAAFLLLALRQMLLIALIVLAPLAILVWIFPGNDKFWKIWRETFTGLLLLYPLVMLLIGAGRAFAVLVRGAEGSGLLQTILILTAYVGPYFFIPAAFKFAGGAFANISGMVNNKSRGLFDRQKKYRERKYGEKGRDIKAGDYYKHGPGKKRLNSMLAGTATGPRGQFGIGGKGRQATARNASVYANQALKDDAKLNDLAQSSDEGIAVMALSGGDARGGRLAANRLRESWIQQRQARNAAAVQAGTMTQAAADTDNANFAVEAEERAQRGFDAASAVGFSKIRAQGGLALMGQNKSRAIVPGEMGMGIVREGVGRLAGSNHDEAENLTQGYQYQSRSAGRFDLGADSALAGFNRTSLYQAANGHQNSITGAGQDALARVARGEAGAMDDAVILRHELASMLPNTTGDVRNAVIEQMAAIDADQAVDTHRRTVVIDQATGQAVTRAQRVEYDPTQHNANPRSAANPGGGWDPNDIARGSRVERRNVTVGDQLQPRARTHQREDPDILAQQQQQQSDRRLKRNIEKIQVLANGITLYSFQYLWSTQRYVGVMAQDLLESHPEAVYVDSNGFYGVYYAKLGLKMMTVEEWEAQKSFTAIKA